MSSDWDLKPFLWTIKIMGLSSFHYRNVKGVKRLCISRRDKIRSTVALCISQVCCWSVLLYWLYHTNDFNLKIYNKTGNIYLNINIIFSGLLLSGIYIYFYVSQECYLKVIELVQNCRDSYLHQPCQGLTLRKIYFLYVFLSTTGALNYCVAFAYSELQLGAFISYLVMLPLSFAICGIIIMMHICITKILSSCLKIINNEMCEIVKTNVLCQNRKRLIDLLKERKSILDICEYELSYKIGLILLPIVAYAMFYIPSGPFYLITVVFERKIEVKVNASIHYIINFYWELPMLVAFVMMMTSNDIQNEVNGFY